MSLLTSARSFLFVPASRPERFTKALASDADAVIIDLEDAVPAADRANARVALAEAWPTLAAHTGRLLIRINAVGSSDHAEDLALCAQLAPSGIVLPKAEGAEHIASVAGTCRHSALLPMIESAAGWEAIDAIARAPGTLRLLFGNIDFQVDLGMDCGDDESELAPVRLALVAASRRAGLAAPVDGVTVTTDNDARIAAATDRARRFGFGAKLCIHPRQIAAVHAAFAPTEQDVAWALRVRAAAAEARGGAVKLDDRMIDRPVILMAERTLALAGTGKKS